MSSWVSLGSKKASKKSWRKRTAKKRVEVPSKARTPPPQTRNEDPPAAEDPSISKVAQSTVTTNNEDLAAKTGTLKKAESPDVKNQEATPKKPKSSQGRITTPKAIEVTRPVSNGVSNGVNAKPARDQKPAQTTAERLRTSWSRRAAAKPTPTKTSRFPTRRPAKAGRPAAQQQGGGEQQQKPAPAAKKAVAPPAKKVAVAKKAPETQKKASDEKPPKIDVVATAKKPTPTSTEATPSDSKPELGTSASKSGSSKAKTKAGIAISWTPRLKQGEDEENTVVVTSPNRSTPGTVPGMNAGAPVFSFPGGFPAPGGPMGGMVSPGPHGVSPRGLNPNAGEFVPSPPSATSPTGAAGMPNKPNNPIPLVSQQRIRETLKPFVNSNSFTPTAGAAPGGGTEGPATRPDSGGEPRMINGLFVTEHGAAELSRRFGAPAYGGVFGAPGVPGGPNGAGGPPNAPFKSDETPVYSLIKPYFNQ